MRKIICTLIAMSMAFLSQAQLFHCDIKNITQPNNTTIEFDVYIYSTGTDVLRLGGFQGGIYFNYNALANGGTITGSFVAGSSYNPSTNSQLPSPQNAANWNINTTSHQIRMLASIQTQFANAAIIPNTAPGIRLGTFRMINTVPFSSCVRPDFTWSFISGSGLTKSATVGWVNNATTQTTFTTQTSFSYTNQGPEYYIASNPMINNPIPITTISATSCGSYTFQGTTYTTTGTYYDTLTSVSGCDSIFQLNLTIHQQPDIQPEPLASLTCGGCVDIANLISPLSVMPAGCDTNYYTNTSYTTLFPNPHNVCSANTVYMIVKNVLPTCADTAMVTIGVGSTSNQIANQSGTNTTTCSNIPIANGVISNGNTMLFTNPLDCKRIATVTDANNGVALGLTSVEETINCSVPTYNNQPYLKRSYHITPSVQDSATVCLYYLQDDITTYNTYAQANGWPSINPTTLSGLTISQTHHGNFNTPGHTVTVIPNANLTKTFDAANSIWTVCFHVDSFSYFYAHAVNPLNSALGISLETFNAVKNNGQSVISWTTSNEKNNDYFLVERSNNAVDFYPISTSIYSKGINGNSSETLHYQFIDEHPNGGHNYYRLAQYDRDAKGTKSEAVDVYFGNNIPVRIYPNPAHEVVQVDIQTNRATSVQLYITDATGRKVQQSADQLGVGLNTLSLDIHTLQSGAYFIHVENQFGLHEVQKLVKQ